MPESPIELRYFSTDRIPDEELQFREKINGGNIADAEAYRLQRVREELGIEQAGVISGYILDIPISPVQINIVSSEITEPSQVVLDELKVIFPEFRENEQKMFVFAALSNTILKIRNKLPGSR